MPAPSRDHLERDVAADQYALPADCSAGAQTVPDSLPQFCHTVRMACHLFQGITEVTMSHNEAWHFSRLGTVLERADKTPAFWT